MKRLILVPSGAWGDCGVYKLQHVPTGVFILGISQDLGARRANCLSRLRTGVYPNAQLQSCWDEAPEMEFYAFVTATRDQAWEVEMDLHQQMQDNPLFINPLSMRKRKRTQLDNRLREPTSIDLAAVVARHQQSPLWTFMK